MNLSLEPIHYIAFLFLIKLAIVMIVAAMLANFQYFSIMLFMPFKNLGTRYKIAFIFGASLVVGIILRFQANYHAMDITVPGLFICGLISGFLPVITVSALLSLILLFFSPEYFTVLLYFLSALMGTLFYRTNLFEYKKNFYRLTLAMLPVVVASVVLYRYAPSGSIFVLTNETIQVDILAIVANLLSVFLVLFVFRYHKTKIELVDNSYNLNKARLAILSSKINPHFLFNTLNTIASAIRINPEIAREIVFRLSEILRYALNTENEFKPLKDEIDFIENYLLIERLRFGEERLLVEINIENNAKEILVPSMLIQPIVENSIKHGVKDLTDRRGVVKIKAVHYKEGNEPFLLIEVLDNGKGIETDEEALFSKGIGLPNVRDRLKLLYGDSARFIFSSVVDDQTSVSIIIPARR